jgi:hypothetical protein
VSVKAQGMTRNRAKEEKSTGLCDIYKADLMPLEYVVYYNILGGRGKRKEETRVKLFVIHPTPFLKNSLEMNRKTKHQSRTNI